MNEEDEIMPDTRLRNPLFSYLLREDGWVVVIAQGDGGGRSECAFDDPALALSAAKGLEDVAHILNIYGRYGVDAAMDYLAADAAEIITDHDLEQLLNEGE